MVCISLTISDVERFFHVLDSHLYIIFGEMSVPVLTLPAFFLVVGVVLFFKWLHQWHMEVPGPGTESELQL